VQPGRRRVSSRAAVVRVAALTALGSSALAVSIASPAVADPKTALVVLPPGEGNTITLSGYAQNQAGTGCDGLGAHYCDQMELYKNWGFRQAPLSPDPAHVARSASTEQPAAGVTIVRDGDGVPHIFATGPDRATIEGRLAFGTGYAQAEERLFQMDILRRAAEGRLSDLLGSQYVQMDVLTRRDSETDAERQAQINALDPTNRASLERYADGINAVIARDRNDPNSMPAGLTLAQDSLAPWTPSDTLAIIILEIHNIAESAGNEVGYGDLARGWAARYGIPRAAAVLNDVQLTGAPDTPVTIPRRGSAVTTTDGQRYSFLSYAPTDTARRITELDASITPAHQEMLSGDRAIANATATLGLPRFGSNAWAIAPSRSRTGNALLWGAPQVGYYAPEVFDELELSGGRTHVRGVGVPGGGPGVVIGYTPHTAWSITDAQDDEVDTYVDRIRPASGGGYEYFWRGAWHAVQQRTETLSVRAQTPTLPLTGTLAPPVYSHKTVTLYRTTHGTPSHELPCSVFYLDPAAGRSYCKVRAYWGTELQTGLSLVHINQAADLGAFDAAAREDTAGFNFMYADDRGNIAWWHAGRVPIRPRGLDSRLPAPGNGSFDWRGYLDPRRWPHVVNPAQGWLASWNNKPQASWHDSGDGVLWGAFQRVGQPMSLLAARHTFDVPAAWGVAKRAGELDLRATLGFKPFITALAKRSDLTSVERAAVAAVARWDGTAFYPDGAERDNAGQPTGKIASPAFAIMDAWFAAIERQVATPVFGPALAGLGPDAETGLRSLTQTPGTISPKYEFFDQYDAFVYNVLKGHTRERGYLGGASISNASLTALRAAVSQLTASQGSDPARWRADMPMIAFTALDVSSIPSIPWENRGTWGMAIELGGAPGSAGPCSARSTRIPTRSPGARIVLVRAYENGRLVLSRRGRSLTSITVPRPRGARAFVVTVIAYTDRGGRLLSTRTYLGCTKTRRR
jgi:penicillin amidase